MPVPRRHPGARPEWACLRPAHTSSEDTPILGVPPGVIHLRVNRPLDWTIGLAPSYNAGRREPDPKNGDVPMDKTKLIETLNEILKWEYAGLVQYTQFSFVVRGPLREVYHEFFRENGEEALGHAHKI